MSHKNATELWVRDERGEIRLATGEEIVSEARRVMNRKVHRGTSLTSPQAVRDFLSIKLGALEHESFCVLLLDSRHRLIEYVELFRGTIDGRKRSPPRGRQVGRWQKMPRLLVLGPSAPIGRVSRNRPKRMS